MAASSTLSIVVVVLFGGTGVGYLLRAIVGTPEDINRVSDLLHVFMCIAMMAMPWGWSIAFPPSSQVIVFGLGAAFYLVLALRRSAVLSAADYHSAHHAGRGSLVYHALMMAAMVFTAVEMSGSSSGASMSISMPDMEMSAGHGLGLGADTKWLAGTTLDWALVIFFGIATAWYLVRLIRPTGHGQRSISAAEARVNATLLLSMSADMALAFIPA